MNNTLEKDCYCLGDIDVDKYDPWRMTKEKHKAILEVCRNAWVTFHEVKIAKDVGGSYNILPIKEQCGVKDPYINAYGELAGTRRNYTYQDTCACVKDPRKTNSKSKNTMISIVFSGQKCTSCRRYV